MLVSESISLLIVKYVNEESMQDFLAKFVKLALAIFYSVEKRLF